jgi:hypothetical protein
VQSTPNNAAKWGPKAGRAAVSKGPFTLHFNVQADCRLHGLFRIPSPFQDYSLQAVQNRHIDFRRTQTIEVDA